MNQIYEINGNKPRLGSSHLNELHESELQFVSLVEFIRSKLSLLVAHVTGVIDLSLAHALPLGALLYQAN